MPYTEVIFDAVNQVTNAPAGFGNLPKDLLAPSRAIMLPDESFPSYFLDVFGRPQRSSACECERVKEANLAQALHLLNSMEVQTKLARPGGRAELLAKDQRSDGDKVDEIFPVGIRTLADARASSKLLWLTSTGTPRTSGWLIRTCCGR